MTTKVKRYGWKTGESGTRHEYVTKEERDSAVVDGGWRKYTVTRTVRAKGRPLWWAIRQLQEGRAVQDAHGEVYLDVRVLMYEASCVRDGSALPAWAQSWTLVGVGP